MLGLADDVEAVPDAVDEKDVGVPRRAEEQTCALGAAETRVARLIFFVDIGFDFDDAPAQERAARLVYQVAAD
jgi:hypothetical protein